MREKTNAYNPNFFRYDFHYTRGRGRQILPSKASNINSSMQKKIITKDPSYSEELAECECVAVVTMKTSMPTDKVKMWWYEAWMKDLGDEMDDAILEDLLLYDYSNNPEFMGMYYSMDETDTFLLCWMLLRNDNGNLSPICYTDFFIARKV